MCYNVRNKSSFCQETERGWNDLDSHKKKMTAPIVVSVLMILYYVVYFGFLITLLEGFGKLVFGIVPLALTILTIKVCIERINEIRKGEEDDLSKY